jgi:Flp pilus assembly protein CpaB
MRNRIISILGILIIFLAVGAYILFDTNVRQNSEAMGVDVLVAKVNITEGTIIKSVDQARDMFKAVRVPLSEEVPTAIRVEIVTERRGGIAGFFKNITNMFVPEDPQISTASLQKLVNKKVTTSILTNQQVPEIFLSSDTMEYAPDERLFAVPVSYLHSVGGEIKKNDYVDLWIRYDNNADRDQKGTAEKLLGPLRIIKLKNSSNQEIKSGSDGIPSVVIFKLTEDQIKKLSEIMQKGDMFLTKWGVNPNRINLDSVLENAN